MTLELYIIELRHDGTVCFFFVWSGHVFAKHTGGCEILEETQLTQTRFADYRA